MNSTLAPLQCTDVSWYKPEGGLHVHSEVYRVTRRLFSPKGYYRVFVTHNLVCIYLFTFSATINRTSKGLRCI